MLKVNLVQDGKNRVQILVRGRQEKTFWRKAEQNFEDLEFEFEDKKKFNVREVKIEQERTEDNRNVISEEINISLTPS